MALKEEMNKDLLKNPQNTNKQVKEMDKTFQDLKMEIEAIKTSKGLKKSWDGKSR